MCYLDRLLPCDQRLDALRHRQVAICILDQDTLPAEDQRRVGIQQPRGLLLELIKVGQRSLRSILHCRKQLCHLPRQCKRLNQEARVTEDFFGIRLGTDDPGLPSEPGVHVGALPRASRAEPETHTRLPRHTGSSRVLREVNQKGVLHS